MCVKWFSFYVLLFLIVLSVKYGAQRPLDAKQYFHRYGFLNTTDASEDTLKETLSNFQKLNGLAVTGNVTKETMNKMYSRRCGRPSNAPVLHDERRRWRKSNVTYSLENKTSALSETEIDLVLEDAIKKWTSKVNLKLTEATSNDVDIRIYFTEQDGRSNILGYAYYPENGDIFFDIDEEWTTDKTLAQEKTNFIWVALHELGHSLGLPHNIEFPDSIMYPYYSDDVTEPSDIDINMLRNLYGAKFLNSVLCKNTSVDDILDIDEPILIKGNQYWTYFDDSLQYGPLSLNEVFPGLPDEIDAAFVVRGTSYFFKGNVFYRFKHRSKTFRRKLISAGFKGIPDDIDAAFFDRRDTIYFFKGSKYYALSISKPVEKRLIVQGKMIFNDWGGIPDSLEAASIVDNDKVLFIKNGKCYKTNIISKELVASEECSSKLYRC